MVSGIHFESWKKASNRFPRVARGWAAGGCPGLLLLEEIVQGVTRVVRPS
jgi:hypothetical protein